MTVLDERHVIPSWSGDERRRDAPPMPRTNDRWINPASVLGSIWLGAFAVAWWPTVLALRAPRPLLVVPLIAHVCGMLAGYTVLVLLGLMSRAPVLERGIGADTLTRWHARAGRITMGLILAHAWAATVGWAQSRRERTVVAIWHVLRLPGLIGTTVGTTLLIVVAVASARAARRRLSYERWHALHLMTYVAIALTFLHQLAGPDLAGHRVIQILWALLYAHVFALLIRHRLFSPIRQATRHRMRVAAVVREGPGVVSIEVEGRHLDELHAESGQFFRWRFLTPDHWLAAHPFSLSAPPTNERLRLTVKALGASSSDLQHLAAGTWIVAEGPYGAMTAERRTRDDVVLIAGGVGITPMRALFETIPLRAGERLTLLYRARSHADILFRTELDQIARQRRATIHYLVGDDRTCLGAANLRRLVPNLVSSDVYLCGPAPMAAAVRTSLDGAGHPSDHLHEERFAW